jgi:O-antigen/teichoic acid export membrane protein
VWADIMNKKIKNIANVKINYIYNLSFQLLSLIVPLVTTPYVSRILKADGIGEYSYTLSIVTYFGIIGTLGIAIYGQLETAKNRQDKKAITVIFWEIFLARLLTISVCLTAYIFFAAFNDRFKTMYFVLILYIISQALDISWLLQGLEQFKKTVVRNYFVKIISMILIFVFVKEREDLYKYALILQGSTLVGNLSLWVYVKRYLTNVCLKELKICRHWKKSLIYFIPTIASSVYTIFDKSMLGWIVNSTSENGYYEQASKIVHILITIITSLSTVTMPRFALFHKENNGAGIQKLMNSTLKFILFISIPMAFGLVGIVSTLIPVFLGDGYSKCIPLLRIFSLHIIIVGLNNTIGKQCLMAMDKQHFFNRGVIIGAVVNLVINLLLIPHLASIGAAIGSVVAELVVLSVFVAYSSNYVDVKSLFRGSIKYIISALIMLVSIALLGAAIGDEGISLIIQFLGGCIVYLGTLFFLKDKYFCSIVQRIYTRIIGCNGGKGI